VHEGLNGGDRLWEYAVLVTDVAYPLESIGQLYRDRADAENAFDELKNQRGLGGFTTNAAIVLVGCAGHDLHDWATHFWFFSGSG
jgi:hypothetical protein